MPRPPPALTSFLAHEPAVGHRSGACVASGGAGYAVVEQAEALAALVRRGASPGEAAPVRLVAPRGPAAGRLRSGVEVVAFDPLAGTLDELAVRYTEDAAWRGRFARLLGDGVVLAHHLPAARVVEALGLPCVVALHSLWPTVRAAIDRAPPGPRAEACASLLRTAAAVVVPTRAERELLLATASPDLRAAGLEARVHVVPLAPSPWLARLAARDGVARRREAWRTRLVPGAAPDDVVLYVVGRLVPYKRADAALASFLRVARDAPRARLLVVGPPTDAGEVARVAARVAAAPAELARRVHLVGPQRLEAAPLAGDVLVHLSRIESWSRSLDEARLLGRPSVVAASPVMAERVGLGAGDGEAHGRDVLWLESDDEEAVDAAVRRAITDAAWRRAAGAWAATRAGGVGPEAAARALLTVLEGVEAGGGAGAACSAAQGRGR